MTTDEIFNIKPKPDKELYDWMIKKSLTARECLSALKEKDLKTYSKKIVELIKLGYTRDELNSFFNIVFEERFEDK